MKQWFVFTSLENPKETKTASSCIDYHTWGGEEWSATYENGKFTLYKNGNKNEAREDSVLNYIADDGSEWQMKIEGDHFVHAPKGDYSKAHTDIEMHYIGWDKRKWKAELLRLIDYLHPDLTK